MCYLTGKRFFSNISNIIENNYDRLSYGVSVTDFNKMEILNLLLQVLVTLI